MKNIVVLENIRSCYNVGNILRTADAFGRDVILTWYTPSPTTQPKVKKTSLGAEESITIQEFLTTHEAIHFLKTQSYIVIAAEITDSALVLDSFQKKMAHSRIAVIVGNEVVGIEHDTLTSVHYVVKIPMIWSKESLNVGQTAAIFMWSLR